MDDVEHRLFVSIEMAKRIQPDTNLCRQHLMWPRLVVWPRRDCPQDLGVCFATLIERLDAEQTVADLQHQQRAETPAAMRAPIVSKRRVRSRKRQLPQSALTDCREADFFPLPLNRHRHSPPERIATFDRDQVAVDVVVRLVLRRDFRQSIGPRIARPVSQGSANLRIRHHVGQPFRQTVAVQKVHVPKMISQLAITLRRIQRFAADVMQQRESIPRLSGSR